MKNSLINRVEVSNSFVIKIILVLTCVLYINTLKNDYALDDSLVVTNNQFTKQGFEGIPSLFGEELFTGFFGEEKHLVVGGRYRPLTLTTYAVEYEFFGENPQIGHLVNLLLYALTGVVLFLLLTRMFYQLKPPVWYLGLPFVITILYIAHPIHTEVVGNIKGRDEVLAFLGGLSSLLFVFKYIDLKKIGFLMLSLLMFTLALLSKEVAVTFLAIIPLSLYFFFDVSFKKIFIIISFFIAPTIAYLVLRQIVVGGAGVELPAELMNFSFLGMSVSEKFATIFFTLIYYIKILLFPHPLTYDYYPYHIPIMEWGLYSILAIFLYFGMGIYAIMGLKKKSVFSFGIFIYLICIAPTSNIFFPVGVFMNERFVYGASLGFVIVLAYLIIDKLPKFLKSFKDSNITVGIFILLIVVLYSFKTIDRNRAWKNDYILFTTDVKTSINGAKSNCSAGGSILEECEKMNLILSDQSLITIDDFSQKLKDSTLLRQKRIDELLMATTSVGVKQNIASHRQSMLSLAIGYLEHAIEIHPTYNDALLLLGNAYYQFDGNYKRAHIPYMQILDKVPNHGLVFKNIGIMMRTVVGPDERISVCKDVLERNPSRYEFIYEIGKIYSRDKQELDSGLVYFKKCQTLKPNDPRILEDLGVTYGMKKDYLKSNEFLLQALSLNPENPGLMINIGVNFNSLGEIEKSQQYFKSADSLKAVL